MVNRSYPAATGAGFTLLEILVTIIVIGIAASAIMGVYVRMASTSANPMVQQQAVAVAEAYLEEILHKQFCHDPPPQPVPACPNETGGAEPGEARGQFNDIQDYNDASVDGGVRDQNGNPIAGLEEYTVEVSVIPSVLGGVAAANVRRIDVAVSHPVAGRIELSGFRARY